MFTALFALSFTLSDLIFPKADRFNCIRTAPFHPRIHNFGNCGIGGRLHAQLAPFATKTIDCKAYDGENMRQIFARGLKNVTGGSAVEIGCGVGMLTEELVKEEVFDRVLAVDTSLEMIEAARKRIKGVPFVAMNGVDTHRLDVDASIACMVTHELPVHASKELMRSMLTSTANKVGDAWIVDIDPTYTPNWSMRSGEPYVMEYLSGIDDAVFEVAQEGGCRAETFSLFPGHVRVWRLRHRE